jgi:hypothetical protein
MIKNMSPRLFIQIHYYEKIAFKRPDKRKKISSDDFDIPSYADWRLLIKINHNVSQLKKIARFYKQKVSGNKNQLVNRLYNYLRLSFYTLKIQKKWRGYLRRTINILKGEACFNRQCTNSTDFLTLDKIKDIPYEQFFSYKDEDGFIYGFNIKSIYNLKKNSDITRNPYNRKIMSHKTLNNMNRYIKIGKILGEPVRINIENSLDHMSENKRIELKAISIFQKIDSFGHITDTKWFMDLGKSELIAFLRHLHDIWNYRAQIADDIKYLISPPNGRPFLGSQMNILHNKSIQKVQRKVLYIIENFILKSQDQEYQKLGVMYVLGAFTLVSNSAAISLPWLYQSMQLH